MSEFLYFVFSDLSGIAGDLSSIRAHMFLVSELICLLLYICRKRITSGVLRVCPELKTKKLTNQSCAANKHLPNITFTLYNVISFS